MAMDLVGLSDEALVHEELRLERQLVIAAMAASVGKISDTSALKQLRRSIARCRTEERRREIGAGLLKDSLRGRFRASFVAVRGEASGPGSFLADVANKFE
jgi:ribosomal protein L29